MEILDVSNNKECRICFLTDTDNLDMEFLNPCACNGTSKWVHITCLNRWRASNQNPTSSNICSECRTEYNIIVNTNQHETMIYKYGFSRNIFYILNGLSISISLFIYVIDQSTNYEITKFLCDDTDIFNNYNQTLVNVIFYYDIGSYFMINCFIMQFTFNILCYIKKRKEFFNLIYPDIIAIFLNNQLFFPFLKITIAIKHLQFFVSVYSVSVFFMIFLLRKLLNKSNKIVRRFNLNINIQDTILPYNPISDGYEGDSDSSIEPFPVNDESKNEIETSLIRNN
jgi:hypothetical protein